jgi:hypothetical protein
MLTNLATWVWVLTLLLLRCLLVKWQYVRSTIYHKEESFIFKRHSGVYFHSFCAKNFAKILCACRVGIRAQFILQPCCYLKTSHAALCSSLINRGVVISLLGVPFPKNFMSVAKTILKRLFRVYAHIYHQHFDPVIQLQEEAHLNTSFKHFIFFVQVGWLIKLLLLPVYL